MSEQSNKPSPSPARAASPERNSSPSRQDAGRADTRAPMTQTNELQTVPEHAHRGEGGQRNGGPRDGRQQGPRKDERNGKPRAQVPANALASALAEARV